MPSGTAEESTVGILAKFENGRKARNVDDTLIFMMDVCRSERVHECIERTGVHRLSWQDHDEMVRESTSYEFDLAEGHRVDCTTDHRADVRGEGGDFNHHAIVRPS